MIQRNRERFKIPLIHKKERVSASTAFLVDSRIKLQLLIKAINSSTNFNEEILSPARRKLMTKHDPNFSAEQVRDRLHCDLSASDKFFQLSSLKGFKLDGL
jgi:hypothetical protein